MEGFPGLSSELTRLKEIRKTVKFKLRHPLEGRLLISNNASGPAFFRETYTDGKRKLKGIGRRPESIYKLAHQRYLEELLKAVETNIHALESAGVLLKPMDTGEIIRRLPKNYHLLRPELILDPHFSEDGEKRLRPVRDGSIKPAFLTTCMDGVLPEEWMYQRYCENTSHLEYKTHLSESGNYVRSKSEALIMPLYEQRAIAFHYDELLRVPGGFISPDFYWISGFGRMIVHEHVGRLDDPVYAEHHYKKMEIYRANGFELGRNLILSFDDENGNVNLALIGAMIDDMLQR